jgi:large subunit ribosomal protein LP0
MAAAGDAHLTGLLPHHHQVYDAGGVVMPGVLDITDDQMMGAVMAAVGQVTALSLGANFPTIASLPHTIVNAYKNVLAVAVATEYTFPLADKARCSSWHVCV